MPDRAAVCDFPADKPVYVAMPLEDYDALLETMELLSDPTAMKTLRAARRADWLTRN